VGGNIYTIGYAGVKSPQFIEILKQHDISVIIDVRSNPKSQYFYEFNDTNLLKVLLQHNIEYLHLKDAFGARQENEYFYTNGILNYELFAQSRQFQSGLEKVKTLIESGDNVCLLCAEIDPINCHRAILCGKHLDNIGLTINHIIAKRNGIVTIEKHKDTAQRLLALHKTNDLTTAYGLQNQKIGYKNKAQ
jgi:uncharacterized protein (DUF488 family)